VTDKIDIENNMRLWRQVEKTDPKMQKRVNQRGGYTAIDAQYQLQQATKLWGPYGHRWGMRKIFYSFHTVEFVAKDGPTTQSAVVLEAEFFYPVGDGEASFPIVNDDKFRPGDDVMKKLVTNTRSKALSWLGFSADVFMGRFDDASYVRDLQTKMGEQNALVTRVMNAVRSAPDTDTLAKCRDRLKAMISDRTIDDPIIASELLSEVDQREEHLNHA
jgi:hypothetical protein